MLDANNLVKLIKFSFDAHSKKPTKPSKAFRKWDEKTPYGIHPAWCAITLLHETALSEETRNIGCLALLCHDVLEDTTANLPENFPEKARQLVQEMTFESSDVEMIEIWSRSKEAKLLKLYDKVSNLLDGAWMSEEKRTKYGAYLLRLTEEVEKEYGNLNIIRIARAICQ